MRRSVAALLLVGLGGCWSTEPDYVVKTRPVMCDLRSRLVRRGYPENLDAVLAGSCTVTRSDDMRGPDFTSWLAGGNSAIMSCETQFPIPFWTEKTPEGKITKVHFCPDFCADLLTRLKQEIKNDVVCEEQSPVAGTTGTTDSDPGTVTSGFGGGSAFGIPIAGTTAAAGTGVAGVAAAGSSGLAGIAAGGSGAGGVAAAGSSGVAGFAAGGGGGVAGFAAAGGAGATGVAGTAGAVAGAGGS